GGYDRRPRHAGQSASDTNRVHRRTSRTVRLLHQRPDAIWKGIHRSAPRCDSGSNHPGAQRNSMPLLHECSHGPGSGVLRPGGAIMTALRMTRDTLAAFDKSGLSRRDLLKAGALVVGFSMTGGARRLWAEGDPPLDQVDSWVAIAPDGSVTA